MSLTALRDKAWQGLPPSGIAEGQGLLETVVPRSEQVSWLYLRNEPGDPWKPINRLFIWQVWPLRDTHAAALAALKGPHPRSTGHYCGGEGWCPTANVDGKEIIVCPKPRNRWVNGVRKDWSISRQQWEIFREIGQYADPYWVIEGTGGGHRKVLFDWEKEMLECASKGACANVPEAGSQPFAPCDQRVIARIQEQDILSRWQETHFRDFTERNGNDVDAWEAERRTVVGPMWGQWLWEQADEMFEAAPGAWRAEANVYRAGGGIERDIRKDKTQQYEAQLAALVAGYDQ